MVQPKVHNNSIGPTPAESERQRWNSYIHLIEKIMETPKETNHRSQLQMGSYSVSVTNSLHGFKQTC